MDSIVSLLSIFRGLRTAVSPLLVALGVGVFCPSPAAADESWPIIRRSGDRLVEGDKPFRFFGLAAPNLQANESQILPDYSNRFPDDYELRDTLETLRRLGSRATRTFSLSVISPADGALPAYITGRRTYNEEAFRCLDRVLALSKEYDVRLIIPVIASQSFYGIRGVDEFSALAGKTEVGAFWTDAEVKADFRHLLSYLVNRRNTVTGRLYRDDPAILAWQFGNEFGSYAGDRRLDPAAWKPLITAWTLEMAEYLKSIDANHLVMEAGGAERAALLASPHIDVMSEHLYEYWNRLMGAPTDLAAVARKDWAEMRGKKPLIIDEFGLGTVENIRALMRTIREEGIVGGLLWSVRSHRRDGGFFYHNEGGTPVNSMHFPGFGAGYDYQETQLLDLLRAEAFAIRGLTPPSLEVPKPAPVLIFSEQGFTWRGSTGASHYSMERAPSPSGPWTVVAHGLHDSVVANVKAFADRREYKPVPLWFDEYAAPGQTFYYRVRGYNAAGATDYSPVLPRGY